MIIKIKLTPTVLLATIFIFTTISFFAFGLPSNNSSPQNLNNIKSTANYCGIGKDQIQTAINFGCHGNSCPNNQTSSGLGCKYPDISPITDLLFAIIRFLSVGVGLIIVGSMIYAGIQYVGSRGEPQATEHAMNRIRSNVIAIVIYIFAYAILGYVIPSGFFL